MVRIWVVDSEFGGRRGMLLAQSRILVPSGHVINDVTK